MTILLISGSRHATDLMQAYAVKCVQRALDNGWSLIAGDAIGVDALVARLVCPIQDDSAPDVLLTVYGIQDEPRNHAQGHHVAYKNIYDVQQFGIHVTDYTTRDRYMVHVADYVMCIWNGDSKGTKAVYEYAKEIGKQAWLKEFA